MLEDIRNQLNHTRSINETEMSKLESRLLEKIGEISRNTEKYVSLINFKINKTLKLKL